MFGNYLKVIWRTLRKNKTFSFINVAGLAIGVAGCLLIALYVYQQINFDKFQQKGNRIARVIMQYRFEGSDAESAGNFTSVRVPKVMKENFPEVEDVVIMTQSKRIIQQDENFISENKFLYAASSFFNVFSFPLVEGNKSSVLANPYNLVLTESASKKYFGEEDPVGKSLKLAGDSNLYLITGVAEDCPVNSQIQFDFVASFSSLGIDKRYENSYWNANYSTYLLLKNEKSIETLQTKLPDFMKSEMQGAHASVNFFLEPFFDIHLHSPYDAFVPNVSITYIYILSAVALLILIIACFTYINLSTASSMDRAREVSIRKVAGAAKSQIFWQFIGESALICFFAVIIGLALTAIALPYFSRLAGQQLMVSSLFSLPVVCVSIAIILIVSFAAGSYPAVVLSSFLPAKVLKGAFKNSSSGQWIRKSLIVFQFVISVFLIITTFVIQRQMYYVQHKPLGYDRDHILVLPVPYMFDKTSLLKNELKQDANVKYVARCGNTPIDIVGGYSMYTPDMPPNSQIAVTANPVDNEFASACGFRFLAGTNFTEQDMKDVANEATDSISIFHFILNESAAKKLGWTPAEAIGKKMFLDESRPGYVRGVVKDFHFQSLHKPIEPVVLFSSGYGSNLLVKISGANLQHTLSALQPKWKSVFPQRPFTYTFLDEDYHQLYQNDSRLANLMNIFAALAIMLACIGLFGLSAYSVKQRLKEIGVRKVLGANVAKIVFALSADFVKLSIIAALIAFPLAWWAGSHWLDNFAYRINISWWIFALSIFITLIITLVTISFQSVKAALANPVDCLRNE